MSENWVECKQYVNHSKP